MDLFSDILSLLKKLENSLKCPICDEKCEEPVRIKTCGHYFCSQCLASMKECHNCPKCKQVYDLKDLDSENIAKATEEELAELRELLESAQSLNKTSKKNRKKPLKNDQPAPLKENVILYENNEYHVNFVHRISASKTNAKGETPLHLACKRDKFDEVRALIESKVDINAKDYAGWAPLHEAVQSRSLEIIEYLLQKHCLINIPGADYVTPLHKAAALEDIKMVRLLLKYGAAKDMVDYVGNKPEDCSKEVSVKEVIRAHNIVQQKSKLYELFLPGKVSLYCHSLDEGLKKKLQDCENIQVVDKMDGKRNLTHFVIKKSHKMSFKILQAMLEGLQFVTEDCIESYIKGDYFINIPKHVFLQSNPSLNKGIRKSMLSALLKLPKLFDGINFFIEDHLNPVQVHNLKVDKEYLAQLIKAGGGKVLQRPPATRTCESEYAHPFFSSRGSGTYSCCNFILFPENNAPDLLYNMNELQHKSSRWFIDCIVRYEICD